jgi:hypothetical protein
MVGAQLRSGLSSRATHRPGEFASAHCPGIDLALVLGCSEEPESISRARFCAPSLRTLAGCTHRWRFKARLRCARAASRAAAQRTPMHHSRFGYHRPAPSFEGCSAWLPDYSAA